MITPTTRDSFESTAGPWCLDGKVVPSTERSQPRKLPEDLPSMSLHGNLVQPNTPPESASGSPRLKMESNRRAFDPRRDDHSRGDDYPRRNDFSRRDDWRRDDWRAHPYHSPRRAAPSPGRQLPRLPSPRSQRPPSPRGQVLPFPRLPHSARPQPPPTSPQSRLLPPLSYSQQLPQLDISRAATPANGQEPAQVRLPSFQDFVDGVEAMRQAWGSPPRSHTPVSPLPYLARNGFLPPPPPPPSEASHGHGYHPQDTYLAGHDGGYYYGHSDHDIYPSPPPEENRHINQKYTTEEGDFIIYAWHDKKLKWQRIKQDFAQMFGRVPERTVQGLQAWYYRMNQRIPMWDQDGWLIFENDDDLEPKHVSIKCRERDSQEKPTEPLGLAQRYPERALQYSWVDDEMKHRCHDWAQKRLMQLRDRRDRRRRKEQRRALKV